MQTTLKVVARSALFDFDAFDTYIILRDRQGLHSSWCRSEITLLPLRPAADLSYEQSFHGQGLPLDKVPHFPQILSGTLMETSGAEFSV